MNRNAMNNLILTLEANGFDHVQKGRLHIYSKGPLQIHIEPKSGTVEAEYNDWPLVLNSERDLIYLLLGSISHDSTARPLSGSPDRLIAQVLDPASTAANKQGLSERLITALFKTSTL